MQSTPQLQKYSNLIKQNNNLNVLTSNSENREKEILKITKAEGYWNQIDSDLFSLH